MGRIYDNLIDYYAQLLIIQFHDKTKAKATIELLMSVLIPENSDTGEPLINDVAYAFNIDDAVGAQLDILGLYIGLDRFYKTISFEDGIYFAFTTYSESSIPAEKRGFTTYTLFDASDGEILNYSKIIQNTILISDEDYRTLLKLKIIQNNSNHSHESVDDSVFNFFGLDLIPDSANDMTMVYFFNDAIQDIVELAALKDVLPRPMTVGYNLIANVIGGFFSFLTYDTLTPGSIMKGFATYSNFDTIEGQELTYDKII